MYKTPNDDKPNESVFKIDFDPASEAAASSKPGER